MRLPLKNERVHVLRPLKKIKCGQSPREYEITVGLPERMVCNEVAGQLVQRVTWNGESLKNDGKPK